MVQYAILCRKVDKFYIAWHIAPSTTVFSHLLAFNLRLQMTEIALDWRDRWQRLRALALPEKPHSNPTIYLHGSSKL